MSDFPPSVPELVLWHRREDSALAERLAEDLRLRGVDPATVGESWPLPRAGAARAVGLLVTPEAADSGWARREQERLRALAADGSTRVIPLVFGGAPGPEVPEPGGWVDFGDAAGYEQSVDRLIWPGLTGCEALFLTVHPSHRPQWSALHRAIQRLGIRFVDGENLNRARFHIGQIRRSGAYRIVPVVDVFEDWPFEPWQRRNSVEEYARFISELREETRGTRDELVFLLYHHSAALERAEPAPDAETRRRLAALPVVHRDLPDAELEAQLRRAWHAVQRRLLANEASPGSGPGPA